MVASNGQLMPEFDPSVFHYILTISEEIIHSVHFKISFEDRVTCTMNNIPVNSDIFSSAVKVDSNKPLLITFLFNEENSAKQSTSYSVTIIKSPSIYSPFTSSQLNKRKTAARAPLTVCVTHNPPFVDCGTAPLDGSPYPMTASDMDLAYETAMWANIAGGSTSEVYPLDNCTAPSDSINSFTPYCATCLSRNDFETAIAYCNPLTGVSLCTCDIFFGGLNTQYGALQGLSMSGATFKNSLILIAASTVGQVPISMLQPYDIVSYVIVLVLFFACSVGLWFVERVADGRAELKQPPFSHIVFAPAMLLGVGDRKVRTWSGICIQIPMLLLFVFFFLIYVAQLTNEMYRYSVQHDIYGPQSLAGKNVVTPTIYGSVVQAAGIQANTFDWASPTPTTTDTLIPQLALLAAGKIDAIIIDAQVAQQKILTSGCTLTTAGGPVAQNNYGFGLTTPGSTLVSINAINTAMGLLTQGGVRAHLVSTYLKAFDPANIAAVKASGGACPTVSTAQGFTDILIMIIIVAVLTALGVVLGVVVRIPGSLESGFSNFASYSELGKLSERLNDLDAKLDAMAAKNG